MPEFDEISHTGGQVTIRRRGGIDQLGASHCSFKSMAMIQLAVGFDGRILGVVPFGGVNLTKANQVERRPYFIAFLFSDEEGLFGRSCPACAQYFRTTAAGVNDTTCPYCGHRDTSVGFLTKNQIKFLETFVNTVINAPDGETVIDLDKLIEGLPENRSAWVYTEERQQTRFTCACNAEFDVLGEYVGCPACGKRTNEVVLRGKLDQLQSGLDDIQALPESEGRRARVEDTLVACVAAFEGVGNDIRQQLLRLPATPKRKRELGRLNFQHVRGAAGSLRNWFGIDLLRGISPEDQEFINLTFNRRHLLSHNAGRVDQRYLDRTGDKSVRLHQRVRIDPGDVGRLIPLVRQMAANLLADFESVS